ncbi:unnamed protein product [Lactuca virosa]|uniref:Uncharacterized protein n=1 Tax=Lactuca virosa TaxID=75947 RepID=A0AAU9MQE1_9ASTR|nr:unnamed protein product [Lactuca virosa]
MKLTAVLSFFQREIHKKKEEKERLRRTIPKTSEDSEHSVPEKRVLVLSPAFNHRIVDYDAPCTSIPLQASTVLFLCSLQGLNFSILIEYGILWLIRSATQLIWRFKGEFHYASQLFHEMLEPG